jgi:hypothetical protein
VREIRQHGSMSGVWKRSLKPPRHIPTLLQWLSDPKDSLNESSKEREKKNGPTTTSPKGGGSSSAQQNQEKTSSVDGPVSEWTEADVLAWTTMRDNPGPFQKFAARRLAEYESYQAGHREPGSFQLGDVEKPDPGTPAKAPQDPASRAEIVWPG